MRRCVKTKSADNWELSFKILKVRSNPFSDLHMGQIVYLYLFILLIYGQSIVLPCFCPKSTCLLRTFWCIFLGFTHAWERFTWLDSAKVLYWHYCLIAERGADRLINKLQVLIEWKSYECSFSLVNIFESRVRAACMIIKCVL